jgi:hypothetical protein
MGSNAAAFSSKEEAEKIKEGKDGSINNWSGILSDNPE